MNCQPAAVLIHDDLFSAIRRAHANNFSVNISNLKSGFAEGGEPPDMIIVVLLQGLYPHET